MLPGGDVQLDLPGGEVERWFGFSARPLTGGSLSEYRFELPLAAEGILLLNAPQNRVLYSNELVVHAVERPEDYLPQDWPSKSQLQTASVLGRQWWVAYLSGTPKFSLFVSENASSRGLTEGQVFDRANFEYKVTPGNLELNATYEFAGKQNNEWIAEYSPSLRLSEVTLNDETLTWETIESTNDKKTSRIRTGETLALSQESNALSVSLVSSDVETPILGLPNFGIRSSAVEQGRTKVVTSGGLVVEQLTSDGESEGLPQELLDWSINWTNNAPNVVAQLGIAEDRLTARTLTNFSAQADWLSAKCRLRLEISGLNSNQLPVQIGNGWFVDDASLIESSGDLELRLFEAEAGEDSAPQLTLVWNEEPAASIIELEVSAHRPLRFQDEAARILSRRLLTVPGADQVDNYVIAPSTRYRMQLSERLILSQIRVDDLPEWQKDMLSGNGSNWLLQGQRSVTPQIRINEARGQYNSRLVTAVISDPRNSSEPTVDYYLRIEPLERSLDSVTLSVPSTFPVAEVQWRQKGGLEANESAVDMEILSQLADTQLCRVTLEDALDDPFTLVASVPLRRMQDETLSLDILGSPDAIVAESTVVLSDEYSDIDGQDNSIEVLPLSACCGDGVLSELVLDEFSESLHRLIGARLEAKSHASLSLRDTSEEVVSQGWIWRESIQSWISDVEVQQHQINWTLESAKSGRVSIRLPKGWWLERAILNGEIVRSVENRVLNEIEIAVPVMQTSQLELNCQSKVQHMAWLQQLEMPLPQVDFEVLQSTYQLFVPPAKIPVEDFWKRPNTTTLQRFIPGAWWNWMAPSSTSRLVDLEHPGWTTIERENTLRATGVEEKGEQGELTRFETEDSIPSVWVINRNSAAVFALTLLIVVVCLSILLLRSSIRAYWYVAGILALALTLVPNAWVGIIQLCLLSLLLAAFIRLARFVFRRKSNSDDSTDESWSVSLSAWTKQLLTGALLLVCNCSYANPPQTEPENNEKTTFPILIPQNSSQVYVPTKLRDLLRQDEANPQTGEIGIREARYTLQIGDSSVLIAEFQVYATAADTELRLPIDQQDLSLLNAEVNGQANELQVGQTDDRVIFTPDMAGEHSLLLRFRPAVDSDNGRTNLRASVPVVPAATLRVSRPPNLKVDCQVQGISIPIRDDSRIPLGPVDELDVRWYQNESQTEATLNGYDSQLLIRAVGNQIIAKTTLLVDEPVALGKEFVVLFSDDWKPIGTDWGDVRMQATSREALGNRQLYTVVVNDELQEPERLSVNVMLVPVDEKADSLSTPFAQIVGLVVPMTRTFVWAVDKPTDWKSEGTSFWPRRANSSFLTDSRLPLNGEQQARATWESFLVPPESPTTRLTRRPENEEWSATEANAICYRGTDVEIAYRLELTSDVGSGKLLRFQIPPNSRVTSLAVNDLDAEFQLIKSGGQSLLLTRPPANGSLNSVDISLIHPIALGKSTSIRRVVALDFVADESIVEVFRKPGYRCQISLKQDELPLQVEASEDYSPDLTNMRVKLTEWDWRDENRYAAELPAEVEVTRDRSGVSISSVMYVQREEQGTWAGQLVTEWKWEEEPSDFVFFQVPRQFKDQIEIPDSVASRYISTGDPSNDVLVCVPPESESGVQSLALSFPVQSGTSVQSLAIPGITVVGRNTVEPILSLPQLLDGELIEWIDSGGFVGADWNDPFRPNEQATREYRLTRGETTQVIWETADRGSRRLSCILALLRVTELNEQNAVGRLDYWLRPNGQSTLKFEIPTQLEIVGVIAGNQLANWSRKSGTVTVLLQPNYLPVRVRLLCRWQLDERREIRLPMADGFGENLPLIVESERETDILAGGTELDIEGVSTTIEWKKLMDDNKSLLQGLATAEREAWLQAWHPLQVGISEDNQVLVREDGKLEDFLPVVDYWTSTCDSLSVMPPNHLLRDLQDVDNAMAYRAASRSFEVGYADLTVKNTVEAEPQKVNWWAASLVLVLLVAIPQFAKSVRESYLEVLATHPWTYWLQLAGLAYLLLPVSWPSSVLLLTSCGMAISQWLEYRRLHRYR